MGCKRPLRGYMSRKVNDNGKRYIVFQAKEGFIDKPMDVPCGVCIGCRLDYSRQWAIRCMHEASLHPVNSFITLTYNNENLPVTGSLDKTHFQKFMKRFRKAIYPEKVRYYMCGEYGDKNGRPHYHALLFGYQFPDLELLKIQSGNKYYTSQMLEDIWGKGFVVIGNVTFESAAYVARYCVKKVRGKALDEINPDTGLKPYEKVYSSTGEIIEIEPEYATQSRNPGIAAKWFEKYSDSVYPKDFITVDGRKMKPPRYYDTQLKKIDEDLLQAIKYRRVAKAKEKAADNTIERLISKEKCESAKLKLKQRNI